MIRCIPCGPPLDQWQLARVVAVMLNQVEGVQHRIMVPASAPQRMEVRVPSSRAITASLPMPMIASIIP